jgi:HEAT repeat protein
LRGFAPDFLRVLRDRLADSSSPLVRVAAIEVGGLLGRIDEPFTDRLLRDASPIVRRAALEQLERVEVPDRELAVAILRRHLSGEQHRSVVGTGLSVLGALVRREPETH